MENQNIFLSYRRDDSVGHTGRLHDRLAQRWSSDRLFWDIDNIPPGEDFVDAIARTLDICAVALVIIGPRWLGIAGENGGRRIDDKNDIHRLEIERAIKRKITVVPVLVGGARMPKPAELPVSIRSLARRNAFELTDKRFDYDANNLTDAIAGLLASLKVEPNPSPKVSQGVVILRSTKAAETGSVRDIRQFRQINEFLEPEKPIFVGSGSLSVCPACGKAVKQDDMVCKSCFLIIKF